jgi:hypothetical protein
MGFIYQTRAGLDFGALDAALGEAMDGFPRLPVRVAVTREQVNAGKVVYSMSHPTLGDAGAIAIRKGMAFCEIEIRDPPLLALRDSAADELATFRQEPNKQERNRLIEAVFDAMCAERDALYSQLLACHEHNWRAVWERLQEDEMLQTPAPITACPAAGPAPRLPKKAAVMVKWIAIWRLIKQSYIMQSMTLEGLSSWLHKRGGPAASPKTLRAIVNAGMAGKLNGS